MKKYIFYIILINIILVSITAKTYSEKDTSSYSFKIEYDLYKERVKDICEPYLYVDKDTKQGKIKFVINIKDNYPKIITKEEMQSLKGPIEENIKKQENKIEQENQKLKKMKNKEVPKEWTRTESWVRNPNLSDKENQDSYNKYKTKQNKNNNKYSIQENKIQKEKSKLYPEKQKIKNIENKNTTIYSLPKTKSIHKTNMNNIYKCGLLSIQKKGLELIKNDLIKSSPGIGKKLSGKIDSKIQKIDNSIELLKCINSKEKNSIQKINILAQATYQTCKYVSYLEYLKEYNLKIKNILPKDRVNFTTVEIPNIQKKKILKLNKEIEHTYRVFPIAFQAYTEYENNITIHFLLQVLKEDYIVLREKLHKALNPINQVVYKIANIMTK